MFPAEASQISTDEFPRCEERRQMTMEGNSLSLIQKADTGLKESIYHALWEDDVLRALEYYEIDVYVKNGIVYLNGHIASTTSLRRVENALQTIPDIIGIKNNLILDDKLTLDVAQSLGKLEQTHACKFFTGASHGVISLNGIVSDENVKLLAEQCVAANLNVRGVVNHIRVSGAEPASPEQPFLQPCIGAIIYFMDGVFGVIQQVVINPDNRRVIQVIIQGQLSGQKQNLRALTNNQAEILEKIIVIPVNLIRYLTTSSGFLTIKSVETTRYKDFNPLYFTAPGTDWTPPYPYCPDDVLFAVDTRELENQIMLDPDIEQLNASAQPTSPKAVGTPVDIVAAWEDDGGQVIQTAESVSAA
jgi:osmotically-inducible protein OsmY